MLLCDQWADESHCSGLLVLTTVASPGRAQPLSQPETFGLDNMSAPSYTILITVSKPAWFEACSIWDTGYTGGILRTGITEARRLNPLGHHLGHRFVIGQVRIIRNQGIQLQLKTSVVKSDYELTCRCLQVDGWIVRSSLGIKCKAYVGHMIFCF